MANKNDDMAGIVSEPRGGPPDVKPAKRLWPRPHQEVRIEPSLEPPRIEAAPAPPVPAPNAIQSEGNDEPAVSSPGLKGDPLRRLQEEVQENAGDQHQLMGPRFEETHADEAQPSELERQTPAAETPPEEAPAPSEAADTPSGTTEADVVSAGDPPAEERREEPVLTVVPEPDPVAEDTPALAVEQEPFRVRQDDRAAPEAAEIQTGAGEETSESKTGRFVAMAAGVIVALGLGAVAFVYGASALGFKLGGSETVAVTSPVPVEPASVVAAASDELRAAQDRIAELEARLKELEAQKNDDLAPAEITPVAPVKAAAPASAPAPGPGPEKRDAETTKASEPTAASANGGNREPVAPSRVESAPKSVPPAPRTTEAVAPPPPTPKPRPTETARADPAPPPPPPVQIQPPSPAPSPEMPVLQNWAVRDVYNGIAVVQGYRGPLMEVEPGDELPGGNRVLAIRRLGGNWAVVTERGIIAAR